jgi:hypothetical protein
MPCVPRNQDGKRKESENDIKINQTIETEEGAYKIEGELSKEEVTFVIEAGLNFLLQAGALPFAKVDDPFQVPFDFSETEQ